MAAPRSQQPRHDPVRSYNFVVSLLDSSSILAVASLGLHKSPAAGFSECTGLETTLEVEDYREGGNNGGVLKFPTRTTWTNIKLRRGVTSNDDLFQWHHDFVRGFGKRRDGTITLHDDERRAVKVWTFRRALPVKWVGPSLNATQNQVAIEELEIAHEGLRVQSSATVDLLAVLGLR